jgi:hypothetical protein
VVTTYVYKKWERYVVTRYNRSISNISTSIGTGLQNSNLHDNSIPKRDNRNYRNTSNRLI